MAIPIPIFLKVDVSNAISLDSLGGGAHSYFFKTVVIHPNPLKGGGAHQLPFK